MQSKPHIMYDVLKRFMDVLFSLVLGFVSLIFYPLVYLAIKFDDGGKIFFEQERIGKNNKIVKISLRILFP